VGLAAFARASLCAGDRRWRPARLLVAVGSVRLATPLANDLGRRVYLSFGLVDLGWAL
jgi:hypothetical protein